MFSKIAGNAMRYRHFKWDRTARNQPEAIAEVTHFLCLGNHAGDNYLTDAGSIRLSDGALRPHKD